MRTAERAAYMVLQQHQLHQLHQLSHQALADAATGRGASGRSMTRNAKDYRLD